ncbi:MAG: hypothetical protein ACK4UP_10685 [Spirosomataceae bacterium]
MMRKKVLYSSIFLLSFLFSCRKTGTKALQEGDYVNAVLQSTERLQREGDHVKSQEVLLQSYPLAKIDLQTQIQRTIQSQAPFKEEKLIGYYQELNKMYRAVQNCVACRRLIEPEDFSNAEQDARLRAFDERLFAGEQSMAQNTMTSGRLALTHFETANRILPGQSGILQKIEEALFLGSVHVVVEQPTLNSRLYDYSQAYFQEQINGFLQTNRRLNQFIRFYQPDEAEAIKLTPDQIVRLQFVDFSVGQTRIQSEKKTVTSKDSVKTGEAKIDGKKVSVFAKVNAEFIKNRKEVLSQGILQMQILDYRQDKIVYSQEFAGQYKWVNEWATVNGDTRALTQQELAFTKQREELPPPPQQLFIEFCKPIYNQVTSRIRSYYSNK